MLAGAIRLTPADAPVRGWRQLATRTRSRVDRHRPFRSDRPRATLVSAALAVVCVLAAIALSLLGRPGDAVTQVEVTDDAGVVDPIVLEERIGEIRTYAPVRVVVWTRQGEASDNINAEALEWARSQPEKDLISPDGRK